MSRNAFDSSSSSHSNVEPNVEPNAGPSSEWNAMTATRSAIANDGTVLRSVKELPLKYQSVFKLFPYFNVVQSKVFADVLHTDNSVVVCAPTGSGKTSILELAIIRLLMKAESTASPIGVIYMAPLKALCNEKLNEWQRKFASFDLKFFQLTGDSNIDDYSLISDVNVLLTTPEKWDSITRNWRANKGLIKSIQLMLIDEIHLIHDGVRGATMEAVISRMKALHSSLLHTSGDNSDNSGDDSQLRFIAVSATAPNVDDIARWLSLDQHSGVSYKLSDDLRPVKLNTVVVGYQCNSSWSEFRFDIQLTYKLDSIIKTYSNNKPTLVFCSTRKSVEMTAQTLAKSTMSFFSSKEHRNNLLQYMSSMKNSKLREGFERGVGYHHAGLDFTDRSVIEKAFANGLLPVLISTSTLAMGVNLPAHLVIIKNTKQFASGNTFEYSETQVLQMIGRAGRYLNTTLSSFECFQLFLFRPQFDTTATAVIMTKNVDKSKYENLINGSQTIESNLHKHLAEHLNSEIVRQTITDIDVAINWLRSTFFYIRALQNPSYYDINKSVNISQDRIIYDIQSLCKRELNGLNRYGMIKMDAECCAIEATNMGKLMARCCLSLKTMISLLEIMEKETCLEKLIESISQCEEINSDIILRVNERKILNDLNQNSKKSNDYSIRYPISGKIKTASMKINCLIQATFDMLPIAEQSLSQDSLKIMRSGQRVSKCLAEGLILRLTNYKTLLNAVILMQCFKARLWQNSIFVCKQFKGVGPTFARNLVDKGLTSLKALEEVHPREIEMFLNRHPPFGNQMIDEISHLPKYRLTVEQNFDQLLRLKKANMKITIELTNYDKLLTKQTLPLNHSCYLIVGNDDNKIFCCQKIQDSMLMNANGLYIRNNLDIDRGIKNNKLYAHLISESYSGLDVEYQIEPSFIDYVPKEEQSSSPETNSSDMCLHKCLNKRLCGHKCCKSGLIDEPNESDKQMLKHKKQQNTEKLKKAKLTADVKSEKKQKDGDISNWVKKMPENENHIDSNDCVLRESHYFGSDDNQLNDNTLEIKDEFEDLFNEDFGEMEYICNEDFQRFGDESKSNLTESDEDIDFLYRRCSGYVVSKYDLSSNASAFTLK